MTPLLLLLLAQQTVAPTPDPVGSSRGDNIGPYNLRQSFETGYRFAAIDGNRGKYRSDVNFRNGVRLLGSTLSLNSRNGRGPWFDELLLTTQGLGNDPYQFTSLRIQKNAAYRYEMTWRLNDFFNPGLTIATGLHAQNLQRRLQDHQLTLRPQSRLQFFTGLSRNAQDGPALSTVNLFDGRGNIFPFFENVRRTQQEYRLGTQYQSASWRLFLQRGWEVFREDTEGLLNSSSTPFDPTNTATTLNGLRRTQPWSGATPHWRFHLAGERSRLFHLSSRFTHSAGRRNFVFDELAVGAIRGLDRFQQTLVSGDARRPVTTAHLTLSLFPTENITVTHHAGYHDTRMEGDSTLRQLTNSTLDFTTLQFQFLGIRAHTQHTLLDVTLRPWLALHSSYQFTSRRIRSTEQLREGEFLDRASHTQDNRLHAGTLGFRLRPFKGFTLVADGELGRQNQPFYTTSERDYHAFSTRADYRQPRFRLAAQARSYVNANSTNLFRHSARGHAYTFDASYTPSARFSVDAGYQQLSTLTLTSLAYFVNFQRIDADSSRFQSRVHAAHLGLRLAPTRSFDVFTGLALTRDDANALSGFTAAQAFPLRFVSPQFRASYRVHEKLRFNAGWQLYDYAERLSLLQDYRAHTGFLSMLWSF